MRASEGDLRVVAWIRDRRSILAGPSDASLFHRGPSSFRVALDLTRPKLTSVKKKKKTVALS